MATLQELYEVTENCTGTNYLASHFDIVQVRKQEFLQAVYVDFKIAMPTMFSTIDRYADSLYHDVLLGYSGMVKWNKTIGVFNVNGVTTFRVYFYPMNEETRS